MPLRICKACGKPVNSKASTCPECRTKGGKKYGPVAFGCLIVVLPVLAISLCIGVFGFLASGDHKATPKKAGATKSASTPAAKSKVKAEPPNGPNGTLDDTTNRNKPQKSQRIPSLADKDIREHFKSQGFKITTEDLPAFVDSSINFPAERIWTATKEINDFSMKIEASGKSSNSVNLVRATFSTINKDGEANIGQDFFGDVVSSCCEGKESQEARLWVKRKYGKNAKRIIVDLSIKLFAPSAHVRTLLVHPANHEQSNPGQEVTPEERASRKLHLAKQLLEKKTSTSEKWLKEIVDEYPGTPAAIEALEILKQLSN